MTRIYPTGLLDRLPILCAAFRTTTAGPGGFRMTFEFANIEQLHAADDEWRTARKTPPAIPERGEVAIPEGMVPWSGDVRPPVNWDGGPTLLRDGSHGDGEDWRHLVGIDDIDSPNDIIAYTPQPAASRPDVVDQVARIIDPFNWGERDQYLVRADEWFAKGRIEPGDALTDGYREKAVHIVQPSLDKARAILAALCPDTTAAQAGKGIDAGP